MASTSASRKVRSSLDAAAAGLTTKAVLAQGSDAVNSLSSATGSAAAAKGKGLVGAAGKAAGRHIATTETGQKVGAVAARAAAAGSGWLSSPAAQMAGKALTIGARAAPWMLAANAIGGAAKGGYRAYEKGGSAFDVAKGAAWGAADQVTVGLASWAYGKGAQVASAIGHAIVPSAQAAEGSVGKKPSSGEAFHTWDRMTAQMESGTMHARVERQYGPMQSAMRKSVEARGGGMVREQQAQAETPSRAKAREGVARDELAKQGIKDGTDQYHERMHEMRAGKVPKREQSVGPQGSLDPSQTRAFNQASQHYSDSHMTGHADKAPPTYGANGDGRRGFQIPKVQAAAQAAKGNKYEGPEE